VEQAVLGRQASYAEHSSGLCTDETTGGVAMTNCFLIGREAASRAGSSTRPNHTVRALLKQAAARGWDVTALWLTHATSTTLRIMPW